MTDRSDDPDAASLDDATIDDATIDDATVVAAAGGLADATVVVPRVPVPPPPAAPEPEAAVSRGSFADYMRAATAGTDTAAPGLDPERRIAAVPDPLPWEVPPSAESGVHQGLPVVYGPRGSARRSSGDSTDDILRRVGPPPPPAPVAVRTGRASLPSLARRERRSRILTPILYAVAICASLLGLWGLAVLAFA